MLTNRFVEVAGRLAVGGTLLLSATVAGHAASAAAQNPRAVATKRVLTSLSPSWPQFFKLDWVALVNHGTTTIEGHIRNDGNFSAGRVRLLVDALDASGNVVGQRLVWLLPPDLTPGTQQYFAVPMPEAAASYRVSVYSFDSQKGPGP
jgi:hypothetical protein